MRVTIPTTLDVPPSRPVLSGILVQVTPRRRRLFTKVTTLGPHILPLQCYRAADVFKVLLHSQISMGPGAPASLTGRLDTPGVQHIWKMSTHVSTVVPMEDSQPLSKGVLYSFDGGMRG